MAFSDSTAPFTLASQLARRFCGDETRCAWHGRILAPLASHQQFVDDSGFGWCHMFLFALRDRLLGRSFDRLPKDSPLHCPGHG